MTTNQILTASDSDLPRLLGEVLLSKTAEHVTAQSFKEMAKSKYHCKNCGEMNFSKGSFCSVPTIPLTWPEAMKFRDWAVEKYGTLTFTANFLIVCNVTSEVAKHCDFSNLFRLAVCQAQPKHYLQAAALCAIKGDENA